MKKLHFGFVRLLALLAIGLGWVAISVRAASVGAGGYTNSFNAQPAAADWSTLTIGSGAGNITSAGALDGAVLAIAASSINGGVTADATIDPPAFLGNATWSSLGLYLQTRPTGNDATLLMCTLVNNIGSAASSVTIGYNYNKLLPVTEEVDGQRAYYSLTGAAGSWALIPEFSTATAGRLTATLNITWPEASPLYIVWADDNGSGTPDTANQIDNFSVTAAPAIQVAVAITSQPQSQSVAELAPVSFTVGVSGYPPPTFQWYKGNTLLSGATNATYAIAAAPLGDSGAQFKVVAANTASNVNYAVTSSAAVLTVNADTFAPTLVRALGVPPNTVFVDFSEPVRADTANSIANYAITSAVGNLTISSAAVQSGGSNVVLTTSPHTLNNAYTLIVNGVRDLSAASNQIAANSLATFTSVSLTPADVGNPSPAGQVSPAGAGANITAGGTGIGGTSDQFTFSYLQVSGNFDYKVRVASLSLADTWSKAALMARETLAANSTFASAVTTPGPSGTFFQSRATTGAAAINSGSGPVNYPDTWLRVTRNGNTFTGYSGSDGSSWIQLGSVSIAMASTLYLGMAASAAVPNGSAVPTVTAQFREFMANTTTNVSIAVPDVEPPGPSSRRTPIAITEIMYNPLPNANSNVLEFIEIYNSNPYFEDIGGYRIGGDIDYTFPANTRLQAGEYRVIARNPAHVMAAYGITGVWGPYANVLKGSGTVRLRNKEDAILLEVNYDNSPPWPTAADGAGHSLVLARPSYGEGYVQAWGQSERVGGSPGSYDGAGSAPQRNVVINEFLANSDGTNVDYIELYNHSNLTVDVSGCTLSDDPHTNKYVLQPGTVIAPRSFLVFYQATLGFGLSSGGEAIYFRSADGTRVLDAVRFGAQAANVASGRSPNGAREIYPLTAPTPGAANAPILIHDIVINEIMYKPISALNDDEYVELYNKGASAVDLSGWRFTAGIDYKFASNTVLAAGGYLVVAKNAARLKTNYANLNSNNTCGNFSGSLGNIGDRVALARPDVQVTTNLMGQVQTNTVHVVVDEVTYGIGGRWGDWANEGGSSLELIDPRANHRLAYNWADSDETAKAPWTTIQATGPMDNGAGTANYFEILALGEGECLVDDVEVIPNGGVNAVTAANSNFEGGQGGWLFRGNHIQSSIDNTGGYGNNGKCLHLKATARGDSVHNRCLVPITTPSGTITLRAKVRWLRGWPEILFRVHGNYMEAAGPLLLPTTLGTPGARNSQAVSNAPPAIYAVSHAPVVPAANQAVVVTARVQDPDGVSLVVLQYRLDPSASYTPAVMNDTGANGDAIAGDGIYSATIPGQSSGVLVAYYVQATDGAAAPATVSFPRAASPTTPECVVRFGDPIITSGFATYRQWMTAYYYNIWNSRPALSNERLPVTLVYGNFRAIQFTAVKWAGSPYHQFGGAPNTTGHYSFDIPPDDLFLGTDNLNKLHAPGNGPFDDGYIQREQTCYWLARQLGLPWNYRRCVNVYFNGNRPGGANQLMEDTETPGSDVISSRYPDDSDGNLYKLQPWFEVDDGTARSLGFANNSWADLTRYTTTSNGVPVQKVARYRHNYLSRAVKGSANDYADVFALKDAADTAQGPAYVAGMQAQCDMEEWMRTFAVHHSVGDWDHFGSRNSQNMYGYKTPSMKWQLLIWDMNIVIGNGSSAQGANLFETTGGGPNMDKIYNTPPFRRMYFRALKELCNGAFVPANMNPMLDAKYAAYLASGVSPTSPQGIKDWIATARTSILSTVAAEDASVFKIIGPNVIDTSSNLVTLTGEAPVETYSIRINGIDYPLTWSTVKAWTLRVPVTAANSTLTLQAYDIHGNILSGFTTSVTVNFSGSVVAPEDALVINEIMYNPAVPEASYVEIYNNSDFAFDLSLWHVNGIDYTFPGGSIIVGRQFLLLVKNPSAFASAYGPNAAIAGSFSGQLDDGGETLSLEKPVLVGAVTNYVVVDKVRYEDDPPWPAAADGTGLALQLIDPSQDNSRVSNWGVGNDWRYASKTSSGTFTASNLLALIATASDVYLDDFTVVIGPTADVGPNLVQNAGFETGSLSPWVAVGNHAGSSVSSSFSHSGQYSLHVQSTGPGGAAANVFQDISVLLGTNRVYTVSFWYLQTTNSLIVTVRTTPGSGLSIGTNTLRLGLPNSPGAPNANAFSLPPYELLWLNEVQPNNLTGRTDNNGEREPWIELYNAGPTNIDLGNYWIADNFSNLLQWQFPSGTMIAPGEFQILWADGQPGQTSGTNIHTSFRLGLGAGSLALVRLVSGRPQITDYLTYPAVGPDLSYGDFPNGQPFDRQVFFNVTAGSANSAQDVNVFINEWMASNLSIPDPADGNFDDWFELYNPGSNPVDLTDYYLTDNLSNPNQYRIPAGYVIPAHGFLLVWADSDTGQNNTNHPDLHVSFKLAGTGEAIGLYAPNGFTPVDTITFTNQTNNVSEGRFSDGAATRYFMSTPTPGAPNTIGLPNSAPTLETIADRTIRLGQTLTLTAVGHDTDFPAQTLTCTLDAPPSGATISSDGHFAWTPSLLQAPGTNLITVRITDNGAPPLDATTSFKVFIRLPPVVTISNNGSGQISVGFDAIAGRMYRVEWKEHLDDAVWTPLGQPVMATSESLVISDNIGANPQRFYHAIQLD